MTPFQFFGPTEPESPVLVSVPHAGVRFPEEEAGLYHAKHLDNPIDTDWWVDAFYDETADAPFSKIVANYSRFVIDLNRPLEGKRLYEDKRQETGLFPQNTFLGEAIYQSELTEDVKKARIETIYKPYYQKIAAELKKRKEKFGFALLFDAHSIKSLVPTIRKKRFPHFILGSNDGASCPEKLTNFALQHLESYGNFDIKINKPFKGGNITRTFGNAESKIWAIQLEMTQDLYLNEETNEKVSPKFSLLKNILTSLISSLHKELHH